MAQDIDVATKDPPTVCIVENDTSLRRGLVRLFRAHHLTLEAFAGPGQVLRRLQAGQLHCAVLVLDIHLGKMSGFDLHDRLTQMGLSIPTIFMTGRDDTTSRERVRRLGAKAYLVKPFEDAALIGAIRMVLKETR